MKSKTIIFVLLVTIFIISLYLIRHFVVKSKFEACNTTMVHDFKYPEARRDDSIVEDLHGIKVIETITFNFNNKNVII